MTTTQKANGAWMFFGMAIVWTTQAVMYRAWVVAVAAALFGIVALIIACYLEPEKVQP